jgi:hypothetical protein
VKLLDAASVLFAGEPENLDVVESCLSEGDEGAMVLDRRTLSEVAPGLDQRLERYCCESQAVLRDHLDGVGGRAFVVVRRVVVEHVQRDDANGRSDLAEILEASQTVSLLGWITESLCSTRPDYQAILRKASVWDAQLEQDGVRSVLTLDVPSAKGWPEVLGGSQGARELRRRITLETNHAKWRDRKVRRLVRVRVEADELWADPASLR